MRRLGWQPKGCLRKRSKGRVGQGQVERQGRPCRGRYEPRGGDEAGGSPQGRERRQTRSGLQGCNREVRRARRCRQRCVREQRKGAIRQVLRSRQVSPAAFGCGRREESCIAARVVFPPAVFLSGAARRLPRVVPTDADFRTTSRTRGESPKQTPGFCCTEF